MSWSVDTCVEKVYPTREENQELERVYDVISRQILDIAPEALVCPFGSFAMKLHCRASSDIDVCIVGKEDNQAKQLSIFHELINADSKRLVLDALVPVLKVSIGKVKIDILYGGIPDTIDVWDKSVPQSSRMQRIFFKFSTLSLNTQLSLSGVWDYHIMLININQNRSLDSDREMIPGENTSFTTLSHFIRLWATRRGIYSNTLGYLGGYSWRVLLLCIWNQYKSQNLKSIILSFFDHYKKLETWDIKRPFGIYGDYCGKYTPQKTDRMIVCTVSQPIRNSARNVTKSTFKHMIKEFTRAYDIVASSKTQDDIKELFKKTSFFQDHTSYVQVEIYSDSKTNLREWSGFVESRIIMLLESLEKVPNMIALPLPVQFPDKMFKSSLYIGISWRDNKSSEFKFVLHDFIDEMNKWDKKRDEDFILINHLKKDQVNVTF